MNYILFALGAVIIAAMAGYAGWLLAALQKQKKTIENARRARVVKLTESIEIIAKAMRSGECNHSEGVLRLKMLLDPLSGKKLHDYPAMWQLYGVVMEMPTHEARRDLAKKERMRLDLTRESAEAELEQKIKLELHQLLADVEQYAGRR